MLVRKKVWVMFAILSLFIVACQGEVSTPQGEVSHPKEGAIAPAHPSPEAHFPHGDQPAAPPVRASRPVVISPEIAEKWKEVSILVTDQETGEAISYKVNVHSEFSIPNTPFKLQIGAFIPDFRIADEGIVTHSPEPNNPGLQVTIYENDVDMYDGWLFAKNPEIHAFEHKKYKIVLEDKFGTMAGEEI